MGTYFYNKFWLTFIIYHWCFYVPNIPMMSKNLAGSNNSYAWTDSMLHRQYKLMWQNIYNLPNINTFLKTSFSWDLWSLPVGNLYFLFNTAMRNVNLWRNYALCSLVNSLQTVDGNIPHSHHISLKVCSQFALQLYGNIAKVTSDQKHKPKLTDWGKQGGKYKKASEKRVISFQLFFLAPANFWCNSFFWFVPCFSSHMCNGTRRWHF